MCRGGRMFAPTKTWRRWHRKVNITEKRYALVSAIAASALPALVLARGHRVSNVPEIPLVIDNKIIDNIDKTSKAVALLKAIGAFEDVQKVKDSVTVRAGKGKMRNRRYRQRRGPLVIYNEKGPLAKAFRNLPGVELVSVTRLNVLQLAPGGHLGRFVIWTKDAFQRLDALFGSYKKSATEKVDFRLPRPLLTNAEIGRIINSDEVQSQIRPKIVQRKVHTHKKNPLKNLGALVKLNPFAVTARRRELLAKEQREKKKAALLEAKRKGTKAPASKAAAAQKKLNKTIKKAHKPFVATLLSK